MSNTVAIILAAVICVVLFAMRARARRKHLRRMEGLGRQTQAARDAIRALEERLRQ